MEEQKNCSKDKKAMKGPGCAGCGGCTPPSGSADGENQGGSYPSAGEMAFIWGMMALLIIIAAFVSQLKIKTAASESPDGYPISRELFLLDTYCEITIYEGGGEKALEAAAGELLRYDTLFDKSGESSDIYRINNRNADQVEIDSATADMLSKALSFARDSDFSLEPAIRPLTDLWDFKNEKKVPPESDIEEALKKVRSEGWDVSDNMFTAFFPDTGIDIGAFAKGYIADRIKESMVENGVTSAILNLGGNVLCIGSRPDGEPFRIAVREPGKDVSRYSLVEEVSDASVVTSGIYERYFEEDGVLYHHILDPKTGYPVSNGLVSVTIVGPVSFVCDAMSTAVFVKGEEEGRAFLERYNSENGTSYEAIFLREEDL